MAESLREEEMKKFISITDELLEAYVSITTHPEMIVEHVVESEEPSEHPIIEECRDLVFKLRAFMEDASGDYALGVETGMQRAADMIENLLRRHLKGDELEQ